MHDQKRKKPHIPAASRPLERVSSDKPLSDRVQPRETCIHRGRPLDADDWVKKKAKEMPLKIIIEPSQNTHKYRI